MALWEVVHALLEVVEILWEVAWALWKVVYALWEVAEIFQKRPRVWDLSWYSQVSSSVTDKHIKSRSNTI